MPKLARKKELPHQTGRLATRKTNSIKRRPPSIHTFFAFPPYRALDESVGLPVSQDCLSSSSPHSPYVYLQLSIHRTSQRNCLFMTRGTHKSFDSFRSVFLFSNEGLTDIVDRMYYDYCCSETNEQTWRRSSAG